MRFFPYLRNPFKKRISLDNDAIQFNLRSVIARGLMLKPGETQMVNFYDHKFVTKIKMKCMLTYNGINVLLTYRDVQYVLNNELIHNDPIIKKLFSQHEHELGKFYGISSNNSKSNSKTRSRSISRSRSKSKSRSTRRNLSTASNVKNKTKKYNFY